MPYFENSGLSFYYVETGSGMPFIFLHGLGAGDRVARGDEQQRRQERDDDREGDELQIERR